MAARGINIIAGIWLFISAFVWTHTQQQMTNTWILGLLCVIIALVSQGAPQVRFLNTLLAIWLFISAFALPSEHVGTVWNNAIVAVVIFLASLAPSEATGIFWRRQPPQQV